MIIKTARFGQITVGEMGEEIITIPQGLLGFPDFTKYCLVDPIDETLILWLQSIENPDLSFPVLEPKIFKPDYHARLSALELRELNLANLSQSAVFTVLTIPEDISLMTANLKAPIVINLKEQIAKQVVLQENDFSIKHPMFKELRIHLVTIASQKRILGGEISDTPACVPVPIKSIPPSLTVKNL